MRPTAWTAPRARSFDDRPNLKGPAARGWGIEAGRLANQLGFGHHRELDQLGSFRHVGPGCQPATHERKEARSVRKLIRVKLRDPARLPPAHAFPQAAVGAPESCSDMQCARCKVMAEQPVKDQTEDRVEKSRAKRILLVDDDYEIVEAMRVALEALGYEILIARDGNQGLAMTERENPDLLILDMMMPKRSGFLVLERIRRTRKVPLRVIMITANEGSRHKAYAEMLGVDDYIRKPFAMDRLIESVKRLLN